MTWQIKTTILTQLITSAVSCSISFDSSNDCFPPQISGKLRRYSRYEDEISEGQLGINEKELNSMNKHIPGKEELEHFIY